MSEQQKAGEIETAWHTYHYSVLIFKPGKIVTVKGPWTDVDHVAAFLEELDKEPPEDGATVFVVASRCGDLHVESAEEWLQYHQGACRRARDEIQPGNCKTRGDEMYVTTLEDIKHAADILRAMSEGKRLKGFAPGTQPEAQHVATICLGGGRYAVEQPVKRTRHQGHEGMLGDGMTRPKFSCLLATCVRASTEEVEAYDHGARSITADTALRRIGTKALAKVFHDYAWGRGTAGGLRLRDDFAVSYSSGRFRGRKCITVHHSRIHHFFVQESNT